MAKISYSSSPSMISTNNKKETKQTKNVYKGKKDNKITQS